jgi:hypothetical protein
VQLGVPLHASLTAASNWHPGAQPLTPPPVGTLPVQLGWPPQLVPFQSQPLTQACSVALGHDVMLFTSPWHLAICAPPHTHPLTHVSFVTNSVQLVAVVVPLQLAACSAAQFEVVLKCWKITAQWDFLSPRKS